MEEVGGQNNRRIFFFKDNSFVNLISSQTFWLTSSLGLQFRNTQEFLTEHQRKPKRKCVASYQSADEELKNRCVK